MGYWYLVVVNFFKVPFVTPCVSSWTCMNVISFCFLGLSWKRWKQLILSKWGCLYVSWYHLSIFTFYTTKRNSGKAMWYFFVFVICLLNNIYYIKWRLDCPRGNCNLGNCKCTRKKVQDFNEIWTHGGLRISAAAN